MKHRIRGASAKQLLAFARGAKAAAQRAKANVQADMDRAELRALEETDDEDDLAERWDRFPWQD